MKDVYSIFEFEHIKDKLIRYCNTSYGRDKVRNLKMFEDASSLARALLKLDQAIKYCYKYSSLPIYAHDNLEDNILALDKGAIGSKEFFYQISFLLENIKVIKEEFKEADSFSILKDMVDGLSYIDAVKRKIDSIISPNLDIFDSASSNLYRIRMKKSRLESSINALCSNLINKYRPYLSDSHSALRNGIFTLMVKSSYKNHVQGIVLAVSDTGNTIFIEPQELIEIYNNIASLKEEEIQEIQSILKDLSQYVGAYSETLLNNNMLIGELDFLFGKAGYAISIHGEIAHISNSNTLKLLNAAHPLIDTNKVVRNDFILNKEKVMVITGPNAGGKTVALKVVGLLVIMHQSGLALPIKEGGEIPFFEHIFADIGDNQSLLDNLSTFSSHIVNIQQILSGVNERSLVIIDELGSGTSPLDGEAIGLGIIDYLLNKNCFALLSSHYEGIKTYALENQSILCASMIFNEEDIKPTYRLLLHVASSSYGIEVASRLGLQEQVINRAKGYIEDKKQTEKDIKLDVLNKAIYENERLKAELKSEKLELDILKDQLNKKLSENETIKKSIIESAENEKQKIIAQAKEEIDQIFNEFKSLENKKLHQVIEAKRKIDDKSFDDDDEEASLFDDDIVIGDIVEIKSNKVKGKVQRIDKNRLTILTDTGLSLQTKVSDVRKCQVVKSKRPSVYVPDYLNKLKKVSTECNVIGLTVKEAIEIISKYLDDCISVHYKQARIIHGSGTGKLRSGVHAYLKKQSFIDSFRLGGQGEGGVGATVVYFK